MSGRKKFLFRSLMIYLAVLFISTFSANAMAAIYYVGKDSAEFRCDGKNDHIQINKALKKAAENSGSTVYLQGPFTFDIRDTLNIDSNTTLTGDKNAVLKLGNSLKWPAYKAMIYAVGKRNITIHGFEINGNHDGNKQSPRGEGYFNMTFLVNCHNINFYDMYLHDSHGDGLRVKRGSNVKFHNNIVERLGHDGLFCLDMKNLEAYNNRFTTRNNSGIRANNSNNIKIYNNYITAVYKNGGPGIQLESHGTSKMNNIAIYNNILQDTYGPGIWLIRVGNTNKNDKSYAHGVRISSNKFLNTGLNIGADWVGGVVICGWEQTVIENNIFDGCHGAAVTHRHFITAKGGRIIRATEGNYTSIVRDNKISNTRPHSKVGPGIGIYNFSPTDLFKISNNDMSNNPGGNFSKNTVNDAVDSIDKYTFDATPFEFGDIPSDMDTWNDDPEFFSLPETTLKPVSERTARVHEFFTKSIEHYKKTHPYNLYELYKQRCAELNKNLK